MTPNPTHLCMKCGDELLLDWTVLVTLNGTLDGARHDESSGFCSLGCARDWMTWAMRDPWYIAW